MNFGEDHSRKHWTRTLKIIFKGQPKSGYHGPVSNAISLQLQHVILLSLRDISRLTNSLINDLKRSWRIFWILCKCVCQTQQYYSSLQQVYWVIYAIFFPSHSFSRRLTWHKLVGNLSNQRACYKLVATVDRLATWLSPNCHAGVSAKPTPSCRSWRGLARISQLSLPITIDQTAAAAAVDIAECVCLRVASAAVPAADDGRRRLMINGRQRDTPTAYARRNRIVKINLRHCHRDSLCLCYWHRYCYRRSANSKLWLFAWSLESSSAVNSSSLDRLFAVASHCSQKCLTARKSRYR